MQGSPHPHGDTVWSYWFSVCENDGNRDLRMPIAGIEDAGREKSKRGR
jgi:hypothetical protein